MTRNLHILVTAITTFKKIKNKFYQFIRKKRKEIKYQKRGCVKKALLVYVKPSFSFEKGSDICTHTNSLESGEIVLQLLDLKYKVWFLDCNRVDFCELKKTRSMKFDLIIGLGPLFDSICLEQNNACKVVYVTENHPAISYKNEMQRIKRYEDKYGEKRKLERTNKYYKEEILQQYSKFIVLSDVKSFSTLKGEIYSLSPTGFLNPGFSRKLLRNQKMDLLWMGTNSLIHKGLDVLLEAVEMVSNVTLHIVGVDIQYIQSFKIYIPENTIIHGFVDIKSEKFLNIINHCSFIILPSCSEAMSTSVLTGMRHGLIPIVIENTGMDNIPEQYRITLQSFYPEDIARELERITLINVSDLISLKESIFDYANSEYRIENYSNKLKKILASILSETFI